MPLAAETMRLFILLTLLGVAFMAAFYLRRRQLSLAAYLGWGMVILLVPLVGPFLAILARPGKLAR